MSKQAELAVTSFDHDELKLSLIEYLRTKNGFEDFNYEGSAINTIIDLLIRNATYTSFQANMLANESFINSAQIRGNVSAHAQKLSYVPRSRTASRALIDISVIPADTPTEFVITQQPGMVFLSNVDGQTYTFTTRDTITFSYNSTIGEYQALDVDIYQGQYLTIRSVYRGEPIVINNTNIDTSTLRVIVDNNEVVLNYAQANSLNELGADNNIYFLSENTRGQYQIEFGKDFLGSEPSVGSIITLEYINTQDTIANNVQSFIAASTVGDYSNIQISVKQASYGGYDRDTIEDIRFIAPRAYQAQNRALSPSDYEVLIRENFPFIRSVRAWGGEDNDPPRYGNVLIAVIPDAGLEITSTLSNRIISTISQKAVGSVTPVIVPANIFELDLNVSYRVRSSVANVIDFSDVETFIKNTITSYSDESLRRFTSYYNESEVIDRLKNRRDIESISIYKTASSILTSFQNQESIYDVNFANAIKEKSFKVTGFRISNSASSEKIEDDGEGNIVHISVVAGITRTQTLGSIDYQTGVCSFIAMFTHTNHTIVITCEPDSDDFYVTKNNSVEIANVNTIRLSNLGL